MDAPDPSRPAVRERIEPNPCGNRSGWDPTGVAVSGGNLWVALGWGCVRAYGLPERDARASRERGWGVHEIGMDSVPGTARRVRMIGDTVFVAASYCGLWVLQR